MLLIDPSEEDDEDLDGVFSGGVEGAWGRNNNIWGDLERMRNSARRGRGGRLYRGRNNEDDVAASGVSGRSSFRSRMANSGNQSGTNNNNNAHFMDFNDDNDEEDDSSNSEDNDAGNNNGNSFNEFVPQLLLNRRF